MTGEKPGSATGGLPALGAGARVRLIAPASSYPADQLAAGLATLRGWGLEVSLGAHARDTHPQLSYLAGADADRAADLLQAWCDPSVAAVLCLRGGYGCLRLIDLLDWDALAKAVEANGAKIFAGASDVTALHEAFRVRLGVPTLFSPMIASAAFTGAGAAHDTTRANLRAALFGRDQPAPPITGPDAGPLLPGVTGGRARGPTVGGNLCLLAAMLGDPAHALPPPGAIVLLEDVDEAPYRVDRLLTQLIRAGWFDQVAGIALGTWTGCGDPDTVRAVLTDRLAGLGVPVARGLRFGHIPDQPVIPLGVAAVLDADSGTLTIT